VRFGQTCCGLQAVLFRRVFKQRERYGDPTKSPDELTQEPEIVVAGKRITFFIEKIGPFQTLHHKPGKNCIRLLRMSDTTKITGYMKPLQMGPKVYRAGLSVAAEPKNLPANLKYEKFRGGKYSRFVLIGS